MNILFIRPHFGIANGLCNQLSFLINAVLYSSKNNITNIIVDDFLKDNTLLTSCPFSEIIDMDKANEYLQKYKVTITDKKMMDNLMKPHFLEKEFSKITPGVQTSVSDSWIDSANFFDIFNNIVFRPVFYNLSNNLITEIKSKLGQDVKINVIHLRIEDDAVNHWSKLNNLRPDVFKSELEKKYINLINKYINKYVFTIVMTYNKNNNVIKYLQSNGYYFFTKKTDSTLGRECNAIQDLLLARKMNNFFIGVEGSTFSSFIANSATYKKGIFIDINNINKPETVFNKES